jgi:hypothetical protein
VELAAQLIIIGQVIGDGRESADAFQIRAAECKR